MPCKVAVVWNQRRKPCWNRAWRGRSPGIKGPCSFPPLLRTYSACPIYMTVGLVPYVLSAWNVKWEPWKLKINTVINLYSNLVRLYLHFYYFFSLQDIHRDYLPPHWGHLFHKARYGTYLLRWFFSIIFKMNVSVTFCTYRNGIF